MIVGEVFVVEMLYDPIFDECRHWINNRRKGNKMMQWESLIFAGKKNEEGLRKFLDNRIDEDEWPECLTVELWHKLVMDMKEAEERSIKAEQAEGMATLNNRDENTRVNVPEEEKSAWQLYKNHLINDKRFKKIDVERIEKSCIKVLRNLSSDTKELGPVKGLVLGNVQSGKTANMAGLMAMAADWGWNLVIVLSGTIENLRKQTQSRLYSDLYHAGNLTWVSCEHLSNNSPLGQRAADLHFEKNSNQRYMTVCLKNKTRLENLIEWLQQDKKKMEFMKILVIDDEADQAGINTGNIYYDNERRTINRLLLNLVNGKNKKGEAINEQYGAMNYVMYTATPYANCLNESGEGTLYPSNFIHSLSVPNEYIGPEQIFGLKEAETEPLNIIREVSDNDKDKIVKIHQGKKIIIPESLQKSVLWFVCSAAAMRVKGYKKPISMLIHTSQNQAHHIAVANAVKLWFEKESANIVSFCKCLYEEEKNIFNKESFRKSYYEYGKPDDFIWDYPNFAAMEPHIRELAKSIKSIMMDNDEGTFSYSRQIHMCIDNCSFNGVGEDGEHMRLAYPEESLEFAPAFIIIGGNTLSRGLTLEGLVSTFFLRTVSQGDTLMQMGRWFGYRPHYELFPRVWMTDNTRKKFEFLADMDKDLRRQIQSMDAHGKKPLDFNLALMSSPSIIAITAKNRMQQSEKCDIDFTGSDIQLTTYSKDKEQLDKNIAVCDAFLEKLENAKKSNITNSCFWTDVDYNIISDEFMNKYIVPSTSRAFNDKELLHKWVSENTERGKLGKWTVIAAGVAIDENDESNNWTLPNGHKIGKISRTIRTETEDTLNIGVLSSKKDYIADLDRANIPTMYNDIINKVQLLNKKYEDVRNDSGRGDVPLFIIYRIKKDSMPTAKGQRKGLNLPTDLIGMAMVIPGVRGNRCCRLSIKHSLSNRDFNESEI